jgi:hypothetical protein
LIITGGTNGRKFFNDWHFLEFRTMTWFCLQVAHPLPPFLDTQIFWKAGRGFMLAGEQCQPGMTNLDNQNALYEFKFTDFKSKQLNIQPLNIA